MEIRKIIRMFFPSLFLLSTVSHSSDLALRIADAMAEKKSQELGSLIAEIKKMPEAPVVDFVEVVKSLNSRNGYSFEYGRLVELFEGPLLEKFDDTSFESYSQSIRELDNPIASKLILLKVMMKGNKNLSQAGRQRQFKIFTDLLSESSSPREVKALLLRKLGSHPLLASHTTFSSFVDSKDTLLKSSAYRGLGMMIRVNRLSGNSNKNRAIFDEIRAKVGRKIDPDAVRAIAQISEDYERDYLLEKCKGDPELMSTMIFHDANMEHIGIISEAIRIIDSTRHRNQIMNALRYGIKNPDMLIDRLLFGTDEEMVIGLKLLGIFRNKIKRHEDHILSNIESPDEEIRTASLALVPNISEGRTSFPKTAEELKNNPEKFEIAKEITNAVAR